MVKKKEEKKLGFKKIKMEFGFQHSGDHSPTLHITMQRLKKAISICNAKSFLNQSNYQITTILGLL